MAVQIVTHQIADDAITAAKIAALDAVIGYTSAHTLSADTDIVHKKYVDDIAAYGVTWKEPVQVLKIKSDATQSGSPPTAGAAGEAWVVDTWGGGYNDGDIVEWSGTAWNVVVANSGSEPPDGTRVLVIGASAAGSFATHENDFAVYAASTNTWSFVDAADGDAVLVIGENSIYENKGYVYDSSDGAWIQFAGMGLYSAGDGIDITSSTISVELGASPHGLEFSGGALQVHEDDTTIRVHGSGEIQVHPNYPFHRNVSVFNIIDEADSEPVGPSAGDAYIVGTAWSTFGTGDIVQYNGNAWVQMVAASGSEPPDGTTVVVSASPGTYFTGQNNKIAIYDATNNTFVYFTPTTGSVAVSDLDAVYSQKIMQYTYNGMSYVWDEYNPGYTAGTGISITSKEISVEYDSRTIEATAAGELEIAENFEWGRSVHVVFLVSDADAGGSTPSNPVTYGTYIVDNWGGSYTDGDVYQYLGSGNWSKLYDTSGSGAPPVGLRGLVYTSPGGSFATEAKNLAYYDGTQWNFTSPKDGTVVTVAAAAESLSYTNAPVENGASMKYSSRSSAWTPQITRSIRQYEASWPAATTTWDLDDTPAFSPVPVDLQIFYNGQLLLRTNSSGGGQGTYYMSDNDTVAFDFTPTTGSVMEARIGVLG